MPMDAPLISRRHVTCFQERERVDLTQVLISNPVLYSCMSIQTRKQIGHLLFMTQLINSAFPISEDDRIFSSDTSQNRYLH